MVHDGDTTTDVHAANQSQPTPSQSSGRIAPQQQQMAQPLSDNASYPTASAPQTQPVAQAPQITAPQPTAPAQFPQPGTEGPAVAQPQADPGASSLLDGFSQPSQSQQQAPAARKVPWALAPPKNDLPRPNSAGQQAEPALFSQKNSACSYFQPACFLQVNDSKSSPE